jgi:hypothetical protein
MGPEWEIMETQNYRAVIEVLMPYSRSLFKAVETHFQQAHLIVTSFKSLR